MADSLLTFGGTEQQYRVTGYVNEVALGTFDTMSGGEPDAKDNKHRPGGMGFEVSYASLPSWSDVSVERVYEHKRDWELERSLENKTGRVTCHVVAQPLDPDGNAFGRAKTYHGAFRGLTIGKVDSTSDNVRMWGFKMEVVSVQ